MKLTPLILALALLPGCGIIPLQKKESAALRTTEALSSNQRERLTRLTTSPLPSPELRVGGFMNRVQVMASTNAVTPGASYTPPAPAFQEELEWESEGVSDAGSTAVEKTSRSSRLPWSIAIAVGVLALVLLTLLVRAWRRSSAAVNAAFGVADEGFAGVVRIIRSHLSSAGDSSVQSTLSQILAETNDARGKVVSKQP